MSRRGLVLGLVFSAPIVAIPLVQIPMMVWARWAFYQRHPDYVQHSAPTISRAISDPLIGAPFAAMILVVTTIIALALVPIINGYRLGILARCGAGEERRRRSLMRWLIIVLSAQIIGSGGMVVCTQYTFGNNHDLHMLGSYLFFLGQGTAILLSGYLGSRLVDVPDDGLRPRLALLPRMNALRVRAAKIITATTVLYLAMFVLKGLVPDTIEYTVYYIYTLQEIVAISAFIVYLAMFAPDLFVIGRSLGRERAPLPAGVAG